MAFKILAIKRNAILLQKNSSIFKSYYVYIYLRLTKFLTIYKQNLLNAILVSNVIFP